MVVAFESVTRVPTGATEAAQACEVRIEMIQVVIEDVNII